MLLTLTHAREPPARAAQAAVVNQLPRGDKWDPARGAPGRSAQCRRARGGEGRRCTAGARASSRVLWGVARLWVFAAASSIRGETSVLPAGPGPGPGEKPEVAWLPLGTTMTLP